MITFQRALRLVPILALAAAALLFLWLVVAPAARAVDEAIVLGSGVGVLGDQVEVDLEAINMHAPGLEAWTIDVTYDNTILSAVGCSPGAGGVCNDSFSPNTVRVTGADAGGIEGDVVLASITFSCDSAGVSALTIIIELLVDATLGDPQPITTAIQNGQIECTAAATATPSVTPTPTPTPTPVTVLASASTEPGSITGLFGTVDYPPEFASTTVVTFVTPLASVDYAVSLTPMNRSCLPVVIAKSTASFSFACTAAGGGSVDWAVFTGLAPGAPAAPGGPPGPPPGGPPGPP